MTTRVQIPVYTDRWARGDRYGAVVKVSPATTKQRAIVNALGRHRYAGTLEIAHVKLDKSGKTVRVILDDCEVL